jgi:nicotinate-nucleotide--dimethylbenzimidazole phosphoribosyltransferase
MREPPFDPDREPPFDGSSREAVYRVIAERRDVRRGFRPEPIAEDVLQRVLQAGHQAPSVGLSQPWDFLVLRETRTRRRVAALVARQRQRFAASLPPARARVFAGLKVDAVLDTPVNVVVTCDPTRGGRHVLGRQADPRTAQLSSALAVQNLWLAARAEGLGVGWVSFADPAELAEVLGLPSQVEVVAYLCVGHVDRFGPAPELALEGWARRRPLAWAVHDETWGTRRLPAGGSVSVLQQTLDAISEPDVEAVAAAWQRQHALTKPRGALGVIEEVGARLAGIVGGPPPVPEPVAVAVFAADHGVHAQGVTSWPQEVTAQMVANILGGGAVVNALARQVGAEVCVVDVGVAGPAPQPEQPGLLVRRVRAGTRDLTVEPALTRAEATAAVEVGVEVARDLVTAGNRLLVAGDMGIANTTASAALIATFCRLDPAEVTGRGTGVDDDVLARKVDVVRRGLRLHRVDPADPIGVLAAFGGLEHAAIAGFLLGAAAARTPVVLDGVIAGAAALAAQAMSEASVSYWIAGHRSTEPGASAALRRLGLRPLVDLDLRLGEGTGAVLAVPLVQAAARVLNEVATFDSAGVSDKDPS